MRTHFSILFLAVCVASSAAGTSAPSPPNPEQIEVWQWSSGEETAWSVIRSVHDTDTGKLIGTELLIETASGNRLRESEIYEPKLGGYVVKLRDLESGWKAEYRAGLHGPQKLLPIAESEWLETWQALIRNPDLAGVALFTLSASNGLELRVEQPLSSAKTDETALLSNALSTYLAEPDNVGRDWDFPPTLIDEITFLRSIADRTTFKEAALVATPVEIIARAYEQLAAFDRQRSRGPETDTIAAARDDQAVHVWTRKWIESHTRGTDRASTAEWLLERFDVRDGEILK